MPRPGATDQPGAKSVVPTDAPPWHVGSATATLGDRKAKLARKPAGIVFNEHTEEDGAVVFRQACKMGLEATVSKRLNAPYKSGPSRDWIKVKNPDSPAMLRFREGRW
jgi:hypothetical protein